jgi:hypothetical protein
MIHEHFCCNRRFTATEGQRSRPSDSTYCTSTLRVLAPRAGLATRLGDFATVMNHAG